MVVEALFIKEGDQYIPTELAGSPWSAKSLHGGATAALLADALESYCENDNLQFTRVTFDLFRAAPKAAMTVKLKTIREGKRIKLVSATLLDGEREISHALGTLMQPQEIEVPEYARPKQTRLDYPDIPVPCFDEQRFKDRKRGGHNPGYHTTVAMHNVVANRQGKGVGWLGLPVPVVKGKVSSAFVKVCSYADLGNGYGYTLLKDGMGSLNTDITLYLQRYPKSEWVCLDANSYFGENGIGLNSSLLFDENGQFGHVCETLMAQKQF